MLMKLPLPGHAYHVMSDAELSCIIKDASEAATTMRGVDKRTRREYFAQVDDACAILNYRAGETQEQSFNVASEAQRKRAIIKRIESLTATLTKEEYARAVETGND